MLGALTGPRVLLSLALAVLTGLAFAAPVAAWTATLHSDGRQFNGLVRFVVMPMTLFAGTFFPIEQLPVWIRPLAWITPLWHGTELARGAAFGGLTLHATAGHLAFLFAMLGAGFWFGPRNFTRRMAS